MQTTLAEKVITRTVIFVDLRGELYRKMEAPAIRKESLSIVRLDGRIFEHLGFFTDWNSGEFCELYKETTNMKLWGFEV